VYLSTLTLNWFGSWSAICNCMGLKKSLCVTIGMHFPAIVNEFCMCINN